MSFADNIKRQRRLRDLSQETVAEALNVSRQAVAKWEGGGGLPDMENALALAKLLRCSLDSLLGENAPCGEYKPLPFSPDQRELVDFLLRAARATYAGKGPQSAPTRPASHDLRYEEGPWLYLDTFVGSQRFAGEEAVWRQGKPRWAMNYCGRVLGEGFSGDFLKEALLLRGDAYPFRGPAMYLSGPYGYHQHTSGDFDWFQGKEEILLEGVKVYECVFHGGVVQEAP